MDWMRGMAAWILVIVMASTKPALAAAIAAPLDSHCPTGRLVDDRFRDGALAALDQLLVRMPGRDAHGAVRVHDSAGHVESNGRAWHLVSAYAANLGLLGALRVAPKLLPAVADWLRWQARHMALTGATRGVVLDHWVRQGDFLVSTCPPGLAPRLCDHVDAFDSTAASLLLLAQAFALYGGDKALLQERDVRLSLEAAAAALADLGRPDGLTWAKPDHRVAYLMDAVEVAAGWRAWAWLQRETYASGRGTAAGDAGADAAMAAKRLDIAIQERLWDRGAGFWRVSADAPTLQFSIWYPDTVAQAWPLLWSGGVDGAAFERARSAWRGVARHWQGHADWSSRNVDPDGFWWPAIAVAAFCVGDDVSARAWVARARALWLLPASPFAWPFQVGDLLWLLWLADPKPASAATLSTPRFPPPLKP